MSIINKLKKLKTQTRADGKQISVENTKTNPHINPLKSALLMKQSWITEKAGGLTGLRKYIFIVDKKANKPEIKKLIESIYKVGVESVNMVNVKGKPRRMGRTTGRTSDFKKAIITLKKGHKIDVMPT